MGFVNNRSAIMSLDVRKIKIFLIKYYSFYSEPDSVSVPPIVPNPYSILF